jgi:hypothetical protein
MKRTNYIERVFRGLLAAALLMLAVGVYAAQTGTEITLPGTRVSREHHLNR